MALSCDCGLDSYDWYYTLFDYESRFSADSSGECYGCLKPVREGDEVGHISLVEIDDDGNEVDFHHMRDLCPECLDMIENFTRLGFCLDAKKGFVSEAHLEYLEMIPKAHIMRSAK